MSVGLHIFENVLDFSVGADHECRAGDAHDFPAIHVLLFHDAVGGRDFFVGVGQQLERKAEFVGETLLRFGSVGRDAKQRHPGFLNLTVYVAEPARFYGSAGSVGAGKEVEDDGFAAQIFQRDFLAILVLQSEVRRFIMNIHGNSS
jgi:hypothetical protein